MAKLPKLTPEEHKKRNARREARHLAQSRWYPYTDAADRRVVIVPHNETFAVKIQYVYPDGSTGYGAADYAPTLERADDIFVARVQFQIHKTYST